MPDIEFIGYTNDEKLELVEAIKAPLKKLEFSNDILFIHDGAERKIEGLTRDQAPFIRIYTRCEERSKQLTKTLTPYSDVEIIKIMMFTPRSEQQE